MNEYWVFTFYENEIFVRRHDGSWGYYDSLKELEQLMASLCAKGVREKKLHENLQKMGNVLRSRLKNEDEVMEESKIDDGLLFKEGINLETATEAALWYCRKKPGTRDESTKLTRH